jgi:hypothetical protein
LLTIFSLLFPLPGASPCRYTNKKREQNVNLDAEIVELFNGELNPVASKAQRKVPVPDDLDLDKWINEPPKEDDAASAPKDFFSWGDDVGISLKRFFIAENEICERKYGKKRRKKKETQENHGLHLTFLSFFFLSFFLSFFLRSSFLGFCFSPLEEDDEDTMAQRRATRRANQESNPFILSGTTTPATPAATAGSVSLSSLSSSLLFLFLSPFFLNLSLLFFCLLFFFFKTKRGPVFADRSGLQAAGVAERGRHPHQDD